MTDKGFAIYNNIAAHLKSYNHTILKHVAHCFIYTLVCLDSHELGLLGNLLNIQLLPQQLKSLDGRQGHPVCILRLLLNLFMALQASVFSDQPDCVYFTEWTCLI